MSRSPRPVPTSSGGLPTFIEPQLASLVDQMPTTVGWVYEIKYDGYRTLIAAEDKAVRCSSRRGLNWTDRFGTAPGAIAALNLHGTLSFLTFGAEGRP